MTEIDVATAVGLTLLGLVAGAVGGTLGIGGGIFVTPALVFLFRLDVRIAVAASLVAIASSSVAAGAGHIRRGTANLRIASVLSLGAALGGVAGGVISEALPETAVMLIVGAAAVASGVIVALVKETAETTPVAFSGEPPDAWPGTLGGTYESPSGVVPYQARNAVTGTVVAGVAALLGSIGGLGGGFVNVPQLRIVMGLPTRVASATSMFVVGVSATAALVVYGRSGVIVPAVAGPLLAGAVGGALAGSWAHRRFHSAILRWMLAGVLVVMGIEIALSTMGR